MGTYGHLTFLLLLLHAPGTFVKSAGKSGGATRTPMGTGPSSLTQPCELLVAAATRGQSWGVPPALPDLPRIVTLSEDAAPGARVAEVAASCSNASSSPQVTLQRVESSVPVGSNVTPRNADPSHPFNPVAISADGVPASSFRAEVTLRAGAELDAHRVNWYALVLRAACPGEQEVTGQLFVRVTSGQALRCGFPFASTGGDVVRVSAGVAPRAPLYAVQAQPPGGLMFQLRNSGTPLTLTHQGLVLAPDGGFSPSKDTQTFRLEIEVMDLHGQNCSGVVTVEVLPSRHPRVTILAPQQDVVVPEGIGPLVVVTQVRASGANIRYAILAPTSPVLFTIDEMTGEIRSTRRLEVAGAQLLIQAYNALQPSDQDTIVLNVTVRGTDQQAPSCVPALYVSQVRETLSPGSTLVTMRCTDPAGDDGSLHYMLEGPPGSRSHFHMEGPQLKVNTTLDYDTEAMAAMGFQLKATIVVTAGGQPLRSTRIPVLVTVIPVNEFTPECPNGIIFTVSETAPFGSIVGRVVGTDRDRPPDSLEYSLEGGTGPAQPFSIDARTGEIRVVGPLAPPRRAGYRLTVRLTDTHNDLDPLNRRSRLCDVAVRLQAMPQRAPLCNPEVQELRITAGTGSRQPVTHLVCSGDPEGTTLSYAIVGGNEDGHFRQEGSMLSYIPTGLAEPRTFVLLVEVWGSSGSPRRSTVLALVVHVTPRSTPVPPSTTTLHTTLQKEPLVVRRTVLTWLPPAWFVAVLTATSALFLASLCCVAHSVLRSSRNPSKVLLSESSRDAAAQSSAREEERSRPAARSPSLSAPQPFDGRAHDPRTGRDYLFNSVTGARRWI
ncbi:cadherin-related family member 4 isoform X1 [Tympanuchus pallidicinctus]|uniref:cadherin-related family member 4 isoform X1 n=1 Tax=Tympanuchus pallidicinctus TaxID=109042 RepID=UPI0022870579|nr:cadherin-related family member 4 isoform X1 [Tympanuchus pallidicinctus]